MNYFIHTSRQKKKNRLWLFADKNQVSLVQKIAAFKFEVVAFMYKTNPDFCPQILLIILSLVWRYYLLVEFLSESKILKHLNQLALLVEIDQVHFYRLRLGIVYLRLKPVCKEKNVLFRQYLSPTS